MGAVKASRKILLLSFLTILALTTVTAAEASISTVNNDMVWANNPGSNPQLDYTCTDSSVENITVESNGAQIEGLEESTGEITSSQIDQALTLESNLGSNEFTLYCTNSTEDDVANSSVALDVKQLKASFSDGNGRAKGFFGQKLVDSEFKTPVGIDELRLKGGSTPDKEIEENVEFSFPGEDVGVESGDWDLVAGKIYPSVGQDFNPDQDQINVEIGYSGESEAIEITRPVDIEVYPYRPEILDGSTGRKISYDDLEDFSYTMNLESGKDVSGTVYQEDFRLKVKQVSGEDSGKVVFDNKKWFDSSEPEGDGDYRLELSNIPDLALGERYKFETYIQKEDRKTPIDTIRVVNDLQFSGVVRDSSGSPVRTEMFLKRDNSENIPVKTGSDGTYSTKIDGRSFDSVNLKFFDRGRNSPDTEFQLTNLELGENPNLGFSSEAVRYQYWESPVSDVSGLEEVNMMAGKFSHDIDGSVEAFMKFDPQSVNPENLQVYECNSWNFEGRKCMNSWKVMDSNEVSIDYSSWRVNLQNLDLHEMPEEVTGGSNKTILMNAYLVGTSSKLDLAGESPVSVSGRTVAANKDISISGKVVNGEGTSVENADVTVSLIKDGESFRSFDTTSGPKGGFDVKGKSPSEDGRYKIKIDISKEKFQDFSIESSQTVEVYYEKGLSMSSSDNPSLQLGETSTLSFSLSNTGQQEVKSISVDVSGIEDQYLTKASVPDSLGEGETGNVNIDLDLPSDYCPSPCANPPVIDIEASGTSGDEDLDASTTIYTNIDRSSSSQNTGSDDSEQQETETKSSQDPETGDNQTGSFAQNVNNMTGEFLRRQSSVNLALGMIMVFTMILAAAIRKKKTSEGNRRGGARGRGRPVGGGDSRVSKPQVAPQEESTETDENEEKADENEEMEKDESSELEEQEGSEHDSDSGSDKLEEFYSEEKDAYVCDETGEEFDTKEGLKMHRKINGIES